MYKPTEADRLVHAYIDVYQPITPPELLRWLSGPPFYLPEHSIRDAVMIGLDIGTIALGKQLDHLILPEETE